MSRPTKPASPEFTPLEDGTSRRNIIYSGYTFRLVSYNILAQVYVKSSYFPHSPSSCLKWKARSQAVLAALKSLNADVFCIQELDEYDSFYKKNMVEYGYSSIYVKRSGDKHDGCGIFYKPQCVDLVLKEEIEYNDLLNSMECNSSSKGTNVSSGKDFDCKSDTNKKNEHGDPNDPRVRLKRDCVGLLSAFRLKDPSQHLVIVANTHIYWDPEWIDVKLAQVKYLLRRLAQFRREVSSKYSCLPSVLVAGDFNSTPGDEVYRCLTSNDSTIYDLEGLPKLCSLYAENVGEPPFTNCTPDFTGTLDYIFVANNNYLRPISLLQVPNPASPEVLGGLPNHYHPSDHLPIGSDFVVIDPSNTNMAPKLQDIGADISNLKVEDYQHGN